MSYRNAEYACRLCDALTTEIQYGLNMRIIMSEASCSDRAVIRSIIHRARLGRKALAESLPSIEPSLEG